MEFWIILGAAVAVIALIPYVRWMIKRIVLAARLKRVCRAHGYTLHGTHAFWYFGTRRAVRCDVYLETPTRVYAIKLFGLKRWRTVLVCKEDGTYVVRHYIALLSNFGQAIRFPIESRPRRMVDYRFRDGYREAWEIKSPRNILLIHPVCMEIRRKPERGAEVILGAGDTFGGMELYTLSRFLGEIESEGCA